MTAQNSILKENEKQANKIVAKVMRLTFIIFTLVYIMDLVGIFIVDKGIMTFAYIGGSILLLLPTLIVNILKKEGSYIKYINVICATIFVMLMCTTLTFHVVVLYVYSIAIASLYFSKKLNIMATIFTVISVSVGQILAHALQTLPDDNFPVMQDVIVYSVIPRALVVIAIAAIFTMLCSRTASLLSNLMGAFTRKNKTEIAETLAAVYARFPRLEERKKQLAGTLSGGEQQMLAMGRALMSKPDIILLDEPSMGLSPILVSEIFDIIKSISSSGTTVLLVEQNAKKALSISDRAYVLETGNISLEGNAKELMNDDKVKKAYLGE